MADHRACGCRPGRGAPPRLPRPWDPERVAVTAGVRTTLVRLTDLPHVVVEGEPHVPLEALWRAVPFAAAARAFELVGADGFTSASGCTSEPLGPEMLARGRVRLGDRRVVWSRLVRVPCAFAVKRLTEVLVLE